MNIIKKIKLANKVSKAVKEIKKVLDNTHLDDDVKQDLETIIKCAEDLKVKVPQLNEPITVIYGILKNAF